MSVHYLPTAEGRDDPSSDETARELVFLAGHDSLLLPDDDAHDPLAVELVTNGVRPVRLTLAERLDAATRLLATGASIRSVCLRLGLPPGTEDRWLHMHERLSSGVSVLVLVIFVIVQVVQQIAS